MQMDNKYSSLIQKLENEELEKPSIEVDSYIQLFAAYLYHNELNNANHLWKRIPPAMKAANKELERLYVLLRALLANNSAEFFKNANFTWSESIKPIMEDLLVQTRQNVFTLVGQAYISIFEQQLMHLTQLPREQLKEACLALNWTYENHGAQVIVMPVKPPSVPRLCSSSEDQLFKLTEFVSFLEN